ncbi:MAG: hypothetical protein ACRD4L_07895 [Pyrinomonadaceae bacterium]
MRQKYHKLIWVLGGLLIFTSTAVNAQSTGATTSNTATAKPAKTLPPIPARVNVKYEGGVFGFNNKIDGTLSLDDQKRMLVMRDKKQKEIFTIEYDGILSAYPDVRSRQPLGVTIAGAVPLPYGANIPFWFIKKGYRYLTLQFDDTYTNQKSITSFMIDNKKMIADLLTVLGDRAGLEQRGDSYLRK